MKKCFLLVLLGLGLVAFVPQKTKADGHFSISVGPAYYDPYPVYYDPYPVYYGGYYRRYYYYDNPYGYGYWRHHRHWHRWHHWHGDDDD
jgi:hypothetical protein